MNPAVQPLPGYFEISRQRDLPAAFAREIVNIPQGFVEAGILCRHTENLYH